MKVWRKKEKEEKNKKEKKIPRWLKVLIENSHRWAGVVAGPPGSGKTTFLKALAKSLQYNLIIVSVKEKQSEYIYIPEEVVAKRISAVLHFTATDIRPLFDILSGNSLEEIESQLGKLKPDIAFWVQSRLRILKKYLVNGHFEIPLHLQTDELERRIILGVLYVARHLIPKPVLLDDTMAFVLNERYSEAFYAMMRPYIISVNRYLLERELLYFNPVIITPGGAGVSADGGSHRLARRDKYVILFDGHRFEVPLQEVRKLVQSQ